MVAEICCAYNVTRGCKLSSKVTAADSEREPLKVLKILIEGLARDSESGLWLTPLLHPPQLARLFPFDFVYLDGNHRVIEGAALLPGVLRFRNSLIRLQAPWFCRWSRWRGQKRGPAIRSLSARRRNLSSYSLRFPQRQSVNQSRQQLKLRSPRREFPLAQFQNLRCIRFRVRKSRFPQSALRFHGARISR